jgi:O-antigen ligase
MVSDPSDERSLRAGPPALPWTTRSGRVLLLVALVLAPWPYGSVPDVWRYPLAALVFFSSALVAVRTDLRPGLGAVLPLAALPLVQILVGAAPPARTLEAALALWAPLVAWLALRAPGGTRSGSVVAAVVATGALLQSVFGLVQASVAPQSIYGRSTPWMTSSFGSFINHNHFAGYAELGVLLCLGLCAERLRRDRDVSGRALLWGGAAALIGLAHLASRSRGGLLALAAGLIAFVLLRTGRLTVRRGMFAAAGVGAVLVVGLLALPPGARERVTAATTDGSAAYRLRLSAASLRLAAAHPLLGAGLGSFEDAVTVHKTGDGDVRAVHAENDLLEFVAESGLLGLAALVFAVSCLVAARGSSPLAEGALAAAVALGVHSLCDFNLRIPATALAFAAVLAVAWPARSGGGAPGRAARAATALGLAVLGLAATLASIAAVEQARAAQLGDPLLRASALSRALRFNPLSTGIRRDRARALVEAAPGPLRDARLGRAADDYRVVLEGRPAWAEAWYELAWVELARGDVEAARRAVERAGELDPGSVPLAAARAALLDRLEAGSSTPP